ncbi:hypothetical protein E2C01_040912 [Portunus trituberculatus]|uniref:Uncharacterized protein n=1 Tax=Portunus trituberculatus TaxID=210409 RepID=A0A5B7FNV8_PORTR|nr:hypothetical protein [Portunus trituberculatus]
MRPELYGSTACRRHALANGPVSSLLTGAQATLFPTHCDCSPPSPRPSVYMSPQPLSGNPIPQHALLIIVPV